MPGLIAIRRIILPGTLRAVGASALLSAERTGLAIDFEGNNGLGYVTVKGHTTNLNNVPVDSFLTNSGTSPKMVLWSNGLYRWTAHNLATQSETFTHADWSAFLGGSVTANTATSPTGTLTADTVTFPAAANTGTYQALTTVEGFTYTFSVWAKTASGAKAFRIYIYDGSTQTNSGDLTATTTWQQFTVTATSAVSSAGGQVAVQNNAGGTAGDVIVWGAQLNRGTVPTTYMATTTAAKYAVPTEYSDGYYALGELAATDILLNDAILSTQNVTTSAAAYTLSFFGTGSVTLTGTSTDGPLVGTGASNRVSLTFTPTAGTLTLTVAGSVTDAQLELGTVATSRIETFAATVTRAADAINAALSTIPFSATVGTVYVKGKTPKAAAAAVLLSLDDGTANERFRITYTGTNINVVVTDGGVAQATLDLGAVAVDTAYQVTFGWEANVFSASLNGGAVVTDTSGTLPTVTTLRIGYSPAGEEGVTVFNKIVAVPRRVIDADLPTWKYAA